MLPEAVLLSRTDVYSNNPRDEAGQTLGDAEGTPSVLLAPSHVRALPEL